MFSLRMVFQYSLWFQPRGTYRCGHSLRPAVETAGYVFLSACFFNIARDFNHGERIVEEIRCVHAVETAGYVFLSHVY